MASIQCSETTAWLPILPLLRISKPIRSQSLAVASKQQNMRGILFFSESRITNASSPARGFHKLSER